MPYHAGAASGGLLEVPATTLTDPDALAGQIDACARLYGRAKPQVLGTIWWYSVSSVLVAPAVEAFAVTGVALDPALDRMYLLQHPDGRLAGARSTAVIEGGRLGTALGAALAEPIAVISEHTGAPSPALWAIATDSIANRLLWTGMAVGDPERITGLAAPLVTEIERFTGQRIPPPRYLDVAAKRFVRRVSCCLIYQATGGQKCVSCPHQHPDVRAKRLRGR
ncbi:MAG: Fe-S oxidoreductase [Pseudonocardiaceae bacterium]|nr:Fe-S oxidoreductase [Pseudonocardiaceae bacterium]